MWGLSSEARGPTVNQVNNVELIAFVILAVILLLGAIALFTNFRRARLNSAPRIDAFEQAASEIVDVIATAGLLIDETGSVTKASPGALNYGLVQNRHLIHSALVALVDQARESNQVIERDVELESGLRRSTFWFHVRAAKFGDRFVMLLVDDRTESKRVEDTRRDFIANVSHELKTPIGAISLLSEAIQNATDDPEMVMKFAANLQKESARLSNLVQEVIQLSRLQAGTGVENAIEFDVMRAVTDAVERNQTLAEQRNVRLRADADSGVMVRGDYEMLTIAIRNLVENAIAYSEQGTQVGIGVRLVSGIAEISVADSGLGISEIDQERIFERFYRVDPSRSRITGGTGLGLSIVKHAAINHRGEVKIFSKLGVGSTFTLRIPASDQEIK